MDMLKEQNICIKFCWKLVKTVTEMYKMLQQALGETALSRPKVFEWYFLFKKMAALPMVMICTQASHQQHEFVRLLTMSMNYSVRTDI
jgi:hypothetical protein